jgi:hypothetical protein
LVELGLREYAAMAAFIVIAISIGHALGWTDPLERRIFALESASRNLGLAFFIASFLRSSQEALPILVPYVVLFAVITTIYLLLVRSRGGSERR